MKTKSKRVGRRARKAEPGTVVPLGLRVPADLKSRLDAAAEAAGRSQGEEAARRLRTSFELQPIAEIIAIVEGAFAGRRWYSAPQSSLMVIGLVEAYLRAKVDVNISGNKTTERDRRRFDKALEQLSEKLGIDKENEQ